MGRFKKVLKETPIKQDQSSLGTLKYQDRVRWLSHGMGSEFFKKALGYPK